MRVLRKIAVAAAVASTLAVGGVGTSPASASEMQPNGWLGVCHPWHDRNTFGGWCDGNGPNSYEAWADCADGVIAFGVARWDGDRRGSYAYCSGHGGLWAPNDGSTYGWVFFN